MIQYDQMIANPVEGAVAGRRENENAAWLAAKVAGEVR